MPNEVYGTCVMGKKHREALCMEKSPLELIQLDFFSPLEVPSINGKELYCIH